MDNQRFLNCLTEQSPVTLHTVTPLGIFITNSSVSEGKKYCHCFATGENLRCDQFSTKAILQVTPTHLNALVAEITSSSIQPLRITHTPSGAEARANYMEVSHWDKNRL